MCVVSTSKFILVNPKPILKLFRNLCHLRTPHPRGLVLFAVLQGTPVTQQNKHPVVVILKEIAQCAFLLFESYFFYLHKTGASYSTEKNGGISKPVCGAHCTVPQPLFYSLWGGRSCDTGLMSSLKITLHFWRQQMNKTRITAYYPIPWPRHPILMLKYFKSSLIPLLSILHPTSAKLAF